MKNHSHSKRRAKKTKKKKKLHDVVSIVGPDCVQVLQGTVRCGDDNHVKHVSLVLCGESHNDAIDVTRKGGRFHGKYGWIAQTQKQITMDYKNASVVVVMDVKLMQESRKLQPLSQAQTWAAEWAEEQEDDDVECEIWHTLNCNLLLLWFPLDTNVHQKTNKGKAYIVQMTQRNDKVGVHDSSEHGSERPKLPFQITQWLNYMRSQCSNLDSEKSDVSLPKIYQWGDLDEEARELNKRRISDENIPPSELDEITERRKILRKQENIWTFDDWFSHVQHQQQQDDQIDLYLILEASVPPWEVELERTRDRKIQPAHDIIRCASSDSDPSTVDIYDPGMDGVGSYSDFCYRKFMNQMLAEQHCTDDMANDNGDFATSTWLHCVDIRDLGCEGACHADSVKRKWINLLDPAERDMILRDSLDYTFEEVSSATAEHRFLPSTLMNPEVEVLQSKKSEGTIQVDDGCSDKKNHETANTEEDHDLSFTFPSFEGFFGLSTDFLYYSPHVKLLLSPFLAKCCKDLQTWEDFVVQLFFGGTIPDSLGLLDLGDSGGQFVHVRSPILKQWDFATSQYIWKEREEPSEYIQSPFFPHVFYLKARDSSPPRTWSSQLYSKLTSRERIDVTKQGNSIPSVKDVAEAARAWALSTIRRTSADPKREDDQECGGEWFLAFLRAAHSDIYEDVDTSDPLVLMKKNYVPSEAQGRRQKYNVGKIRIPNTTEMFNEISEYYRDRELLLEGSKTTSPRVECLAKILIDIWMSSLIDFSTVLKVADLVNESNQKRVVIVLYMGTVHIKAVAEFYTKEIGFRKKCFVGKYSWDDDEVKTLKFPSSLWDLSQL